MRRFRRTPQFKPMSAQRRFVNLRQFWNGLSRWLLKQITPVRVLLALLTLPVVAYVWREVTREVLIIDPFTVPKRYEEAGLTPDVMANRVGDAVREIEYETQTSMKKDALSGGRDEESIPDVQIPGTKFGLKAAIDVTRGLFRVYPKRVNGDIVLPVRRADGDLAQVRARVTIYVSQGRNRGSRSRIECQAEDIDGLVQQTAELVLRQINPYVLAAHAENRHEHRKALDIVQAILQNTSQDRRHRAAAMNLWGIALYDQKKYDEAIAKYQSAIEIDPKFGNPYDNWGNALREENRYDQAIVKYQKAIEIDVKDAFAYNNWGLVLFDRKKYDEAIAKFQKAIEIDPTFALAYNNWGSVLDGQKKYDEAITKFQKAIEIDPNFSLAYNNWANVLDDQRKYDEAIAKEEKAIEIDPSFANPYIGWGNVLYDQGKYDEAAAKFQKATEIDPTFASAYMGWGYVLNNQKKYGEAIAKYQKSIEIDPKFGAAYRNWGVTLVHLGKDAEAKEKFKKADELSKLQ